MCQMFFRNSKKSNSPNLSSSHTNHPLRDLYYWLIVARWPVFLLVLGLAFLFVNTIFAAIYYKIGGIYGVPAQDFLEYFFFSLHTIATVGYGNMYPVTVSSNGVVAIEIMLGIFMIAVNTGLVFAKFSLPKAKVVFSKVAVIQKRNDQNTLAFRLANERGNHIAEAQINVSLIRDEITKEGEKITKIHDLKVERDRTPVFILSWSVFHPILEGSPLLGMTQADLQSASVSIVVTFMGYDPTVAQTIHARHVYRLDDLRWNAKLVDVLTRLPNGGMHFAYEKFHLWESSQG